VYLTNASNLTPQAGRFFAKPTAQKSVQLAPLFMRSVRRIEESSSLAYLFDDKEADAFFHRHYSLLVNESDMGCVLIGASAIDQELTTLFETITPNDANSKIKKRIFDGRGVLGELSSKLDIAYLCHLIPKDLYLAVHALRKLRNLIAHEVMAFKLENHIDEIYTIFSQMNGNLIGVMMNTSETVLTEQAVSKMLDLDHPINITEKSFPNRNEAINYLLENPDLIEKLNSHKLRIAFVIGISLLGASVVFRKKTSI
jgi:hypothetical protein|tara:strand:- start:60 stop:827 length:768 start_codon:yes stop_codon:yes gene_type:complete